MNTIKFLLISIAILGFSIHPMEIAPVKSVPSQAEAQQTPQEILDEQLCRAFHADNITKIEELLRAGANPNAKIHRPGWIGRSNHEYVHSLASYTHHPLEWVMSFYPNVNICKLLIQYGADISKAHDRRPALFVVHDDTQSYKAFDMYNLLFECGESIYETSEFPDNTGRLNPLDWAVHVVYDTHYKSLIICAHFNPKLDKRYFPAAARIITALLSFNRVCPRLPKDIRKFILQRDQELKADLDIMSMYGKLSTCNESNAPALPIQIVRLLIQKGTLDPEKTVAALKANHLRCIAPLMAGALPRVRESKSVVINKEERIRMLNPDLVEEHFGDAIEKNIRRRLGLIPWWQKAYDALPANQCVVQ